MLLEKETSTFHLRVLSLNVWGIPFVSRDRERRIEAIATELSQGNYDIVSLQEVWSKADCQLLKNRTQRVLPYSHYFYSGVIGAGLLVLSKYPILSTLFHSWSVNGYFHRIQHADWFGGKGVGLCRILVNNYVVHLYNAHLHAEYNSIKDEYKTHRIIQAFDTAQFINATRNDAAVQILAGDLNTEPNDICYKILLYVSQMEDCCNVPTITTNCCPSNSYTKKHELAKNPQGIRIDHIFLRSSEEFFTTVLDYKLPLKKQVPGHKFSYSDHEAVLVTLGLNTKQTYNGLVDTLPRKTLKPYRKERYIAQRITVLHEAISHCQKSLLQLDVNRMLYLLLTMLFMILLIIAMEFTVPAAYKPLYILLKLIIFALFIYSCFMASIWNFLERNGILAEEKSMEVLLQSLENGFHDHKNMC